MAIVVKAYIGQLFGSPDVHMLEFDAEQSGDGIEALRQEISGLVGGRDVKLTWLDQDGDRIRLATDEQLQFAVKHGVRENVLRVSVSVDWLGVDAAARRAKKLSEERRAAAAAAAQASSKVRDEGEEGVESTEASGEDGDAEEATAGTELADDEAAAGAKNEQGADGRGKSGCRGHRHRCAGKAGYTGYVRTVGEDGVARERELSKEEAAYLLNRPSLLDVDFGNYSPFSLGSSLLSRPRLHHHHHHPHHPLRSTQSPLYLLW